MKKLTATIIAFISITFTSSAMACQCETLAGPAMNAFQPALASFMENKMDVLPGDIIEIKEMKSKMRNSFLNGITFNSIAAITSPIWLPFYIAEKIQHPEGMHGDCPLAGDVFKAKFMVKYHTPEGKICSLQVKYKARGRFLSQFRMEDKVTKTIIKTKFAPSCE